MPNFDFIDRYEREIDRLKMPRNQTIRDVNEKMAVAIEEANTEAYEASMKAEYAEVSRDMADAIPSMNDRILEENGYSRDVMEKTGRENMPWYMDQQLYDESKSPDDYQAEADSYADDAKGIMEDLYANAYRVDAILSDENREALGQEYEDFSHRMMEKEAREAEAKRVEAQKGVFEPRIYQNEHGDMVQSITGKPGENLEDDGYSFDEFS